jgi:Na+/H+-dicarboxylate symporter
MKNILKTYKSTIILLAAIIVGAIVGLIFKEKAAVLSPFGDIFLNLMFVAIVPLIFVTVSTSISRMKQPKRFGKIVITIIGVFVITSLIAVVIGMISTYSFKLVNPEDGEIIKASLTDEEIEEPEEMTILERTVSVLTVKDFKDLLSKNNIIAILVVAIMFGTAINMTGEQAKPVQDFLIASVKVIENFIKIIMYYAPIGLGCYFAALVGTYGAQIAVGYAKTFIIYLVVSILFYVVIYSLYAFIAAGKKGVKVFWANVLPVSITALATCSSAASIAVNVKGAKSIGVSDDIAETLIPLGTSFHKDGSIIGSVFKIMFLVYLFGTGAGVIKVLLVSLLVTLLVTAVPIGGGTISEMMILTMMGFPINALPFLTVIATIIDAPATLLNVVGDTASSMLAARIVDGKDWMKE